MTENITLLDKGKKKKSKDRNMKRNGINYTRAPIQPLSHVLKYRWVGGKKKAYIWGKNKHELTGTGRLSGGLLNKIFFLLLNYKVQDVSYG